jgi:asparagine synthase (glutamine-hydrolysing)
MLASLLDRNGFIAAYLNLPVIEKLLESHQRGSVDATDRIWRLLNLQLWGDVFLTGRRAGG